MDYCRICKLENDKGIVGKNPDIKIIDGEIILQGTGDFKGKTFKTGLSIDNF